jgi:hypothetical protein
MVSEIIFYNAHQPFGGIESIPGATINNLNFFWLLVIFKNCRVGKKSP